MSHHKKRVIEGLCNSVLVQFLNIQISSPFPPQPKKILFAIHRTRRKYFMIHNTTHVSLGGNGRRNKLKVKTASQLT